MLQLQHDFFCKKGVRMKRMIQKTAAIMMCVCLITICIAPYQANAASYKINLKNNQLFYILPGNDSVDYQVKLTSGSQLNGTMSCMTSDAAKATISNDGALNILDAGTFQVSVTYNGETITRKVQSLLRSDWTRVISITNAQKITVSNNRVATYKIKNLMDFPLKVTLNYNTYDANMKPIQSERLHDFIYLAANETISYKEIVPENVKYITVNHATFTYDQYCQTAHCGRRKPHFDFGGNTSPIVSYRHLPQTLRGLTADCRSLV